MSRWLSETGGQRGTSYDEAFQELAASGVDVHGEASFVDRLLAPASRVLDAGCGTGRVAVELSRRGHEVVGVDSDASMLEVARQLPGTWLLQDLGLLAVEGSFDLVLMAGNVVVFLAPGTEAAVLAELASALRPGGLLVSGWRTDRLPVPSYDVLVGVAFEPVDRFSTWNRAPLAEDSAWCVAVDRLR